MVWLVFSFQRQKGFRRVQHGDSSNRCEEAVLACFPPNNSSFERGKLKPRRGPCARFTVTVQGSNDTHRFRIHPRACNSEHKYYCSFNAAKTTTAAAAVTATSNPPAPPHHTADSHRIIRMSELSAGTFLKLWISLHVPQKAGPLHACY